MCVGTHWHTTLRVYYLLRPVVRPVVPVQSCFCFVVCLYWVPAEMWREGERQTYLQVANVTAYEEILLAGRCPGIINQLMALSHSLSLTVSSDPTRLSVCVMQLFSIVQEQQNALLNFLLWVVLPVRSLYGVIAHTSDTHYSYPMVFLRVCMCSF